MSFVTQKQEEVLDRMIAYRMNQSCPRLLFSLEGPKEGSQTISAVGQLVLPIIVHTHTQSATLLLTANTELHYTLSL